jgi:hypothetical protein
MKYYVSRAGQQYGPYSLADLQRYVASGNITATDLACPEGGAQWVPVSQVLAGAGGQAPQPQVPAQPAAQPGYVQPAGYGQPQSVSAPTRVAGLEHVLPPGLHWAIVLVLAIFTCGIFSIVWTFIEASFVKKIRPNSNAIVLYAAGMGGILVILMLYATMSRTMIMLAPLVNIACAVAMILGHFQMKAALEDYYNNVEPIGLRLSGVMVFFFNIFYFQYHFTRIREWKTTGVWR